MNLFPPWQQHLPAFRKLLQGTLAINKNTSMNILENTTFRLQTIMPQQKRERMATLVLSVSKAPDAPDVSVVVLTVISQSSTSQLFYLHFYVLFSFRVCFCVVLHNWSILSIYMAYLMCALSIKLYVMTPPMSVVLTQHKGRCRSFAGLILNMDLSLQAIRLLFPSDL